MISIHANTDRAIKWLEKIRDGLQPERIDRIVDRVAMETHRNVVLATPKRWTGQTRKAWRVDNLGPARRRVINPSKIMGFLEHGTRDHGPVRAKALFIPLTRRAASNHLFAAGVGFTTLQSGRMVRLVYGRDYILVKRVRGIIGGRYAEIEAFEAKKRLRAAAVAYIAKLKN